MALPDAMPNAMPPATPAAIPFAASADIPVANVVAGSDLHDGPHAPAQPSDIMLELITCLVAPLFMAGCCGDLSFARLAAVETIASYHARTQAELVKIGQIIAFGLAAMDNLRLSMTPGLSLSMTLRLRGGANSLNRSAQQNTVALEKSRAPAAAASGQRAGTTAPQSDPVPAFSEDDIPEADIQAAVEHARAMVEQAHARLQDAKAAEARPSAQPLSAAQSATIQQACLGPAPASHQTLNNPPASAAEAAPPATRATLPHQAPPGAVSDPASPAPLLPASPPSSAQQPAASRRDNLARQPKPSPSASPTGESQQQLMWASAMSAVASQLSGHLADVPAAQHKAEQMWANALGSHASSLAIAAGSVPGGVPCSTPPDTGSHIARVGKTRKPS